MSEEETFTNTANLPKKTEDRQPFHLSVQSKEAFLGENDRENKASDSASGLRMD